jgi:hypothetical protein
MHSKLNIIARTYAGRLAPADEVVCLDSVDAHKRRGWAAWEESTDRLGPNLFKLLVALIFDEVYH